MLAVKRDLRTHPAQAAQVQIDRPRAEHAAAGQAQLRRAEAREQQRLDENQQSPSGQTAEDILPFGNIHKVMVQQHELHE